MTGNDTHADTIREALPLLSRFEHQPLCQSFFYTGGTPLPCNCIVAKTEDAIAALHALLADLDWERARGDRAEDVLAAGITVATQYFDTERGDLDGWIERARAVLAGPGGSS